MKPKPNEPVTPKLLKMRKEIDELRAHSVLLRARDENKRLSFMNGMGDLIQMASFRQSGQGQDQITSINPLITANQYANITLQWNVIMQMYSTHGLIQTAIDEPVQDAHRDPVLLECKTLSPRNLGELEQWCAENSIDDPYIDTQWLGRLFGGAACVLNLAGDPSKPINLREIERGRFALYAATRWELGGTWRYSDAYNFYGVTFDKSRVKTFIGKKMPWVIERQLSGWGACLIARMAEDFNVYLRGRNALYELLNEAKIDIYKMDGYNAQLLTQQGTQEVDQRLAATNSLKNYHQALVLDAKDEYVVKQMTFSGIADVMRENRMGLVAATRIPVSKLFGEKMAGLGRGDGDDLENYYNMVKSEVRRPARALKEWILGLGSMALFGSKHHVTFEYPPLRETSAVETEQVKTSEQTRMLAQLEAGLIDETEAAAWAQQAKLTPIPTKFGQRAQKKYGTEIKDVKTTKKDKSQGDSTNGRKPTAGLGLRGYLDQVPHFG